MGKFIKTALVFMGGMTAGGYCIVNAALKSQTFTTALKDAIAKKTVEVIYGKDADCGDIIFQTRQDADDVLTKMKEIIRRYGAISLADVHEIAGLSRPSYSAEKYGWRSLDDAKVVRCQGMYFIEVPKATEIKWP